MNWTDVRIEIGRRLGDPDLKDFRSVVGKMFTSSMTEILENGDNFNLEEVSGLVDDSVTELDFTNSEQVSIIVKDDAIRLLDIFQDIATSFDSGATLIEISQSDFKRMNLEKSFRPAVSEVFWFRRGNKLHFIKHPDYHHRITIVAQYLLNPDFDTWADDTDLINDKSFSLNFLFRVIDKAVKNISTFPAYNVGEA